MSTAETCPAPIFSLTGVFRLLLACFIAQAPWTFPRGPLLDAVWRRIQRLGAELCWLAGTAPRRGAPATPEPTPATPFNPTPDPALGAAKPPRREPDQLTVLQVTREHGWLVTMMPNLDPAVEAFEQFLLGTRPDDLLDADPRFAGLLRRLGWMLGVNPDLLPPAHWPDPPTEPLHPDELRPAPRGFARCLRVNQMAYEMLEARLRAERAERAALQAPEPDTESATGDPAENSA